MRSKSLILPLALLSFTTASAALSDDAEFDARVRDYLLRNPEVILEAMEILATRQTEDAFAAQLAKFPGILDPISSIGLGNINAPMRVIEYFDYKCAPCKAMHPKLQDLVSRNPDLRIEMRHLPILSPGSERATRFALATELVAGSDAYARVHKQLWHLKGPMAEVSFAAIAADEGLDYDAIAARMDDDQITARIDTARDVAIALGIRGTPAFLTELGVDVGQADVEGLAAKWLSQ